MKVNTEEEEEWSSYASISKDVERERNKIISDTITRERYWRVESSDEINSPSHYLKGKIEVIDFIEDQELDYHIGTAMKYLCRYRFKGEPTKDLQKAVWYIEREIRKLEKT